MIAGEKRGKLYNTYSPLFELSKEEIVNLASFLSLPLRRMGRISFEKDVY